MDALRSLRSAEDTLPEHAPHLQSRLHRESPALALAIVGGEHPLAGIDDLDLHAFDELTIGRALGDRRSLTRQHGSGHLAMPDGRMSRCHLRICRDIAGWRLHDLQSRNGTLVNGAPATTKLLTPGDVLVAGRTAFAVYEPSICASPNTPAAFITRHAALATTFSALRRLATRDVPISLTGPTGTGKELTARAIHDASGRAGPFVAVNCAALPGALIESELFGHQRGAFSGATDHTPGLLRAAHGGTLFLDEIAELPLNAQATLLRALQEGEVRPVGATTAHRVDVRVITATHQDLRARITDGRFREDLYARLAGFRADLPPLRDRRADLASLIPLLLRRIPAQPGPPRFTRAAIAALFAYDYPRNIRELDLALRTALALTDDGEIDIAHLPPPIQAAFETLALSPEDFELRASLIGRLRRHRGNIAAVARSMNKAPIQIRRWCKRLGIDVAAFRQEAE